MSFRHRNYIPRQHEVINNNVYERVLLLQGCYDKLASEMPAHTLIDNWAATDRGTWCKNKGIEIFITREPTRTVVTYNIVAFALMLPEHATFFRMKWPDVYTIEMSL
jgi:hypothetical protein